MREDTVLEILSRGRAENKGLMAILGEIQNQYSYLPEDALRLVAEQTGRSLVDIYGVATFYKSFSLTPRGKHLVSVCLGTACHVRSAPAIVGEFERQLEVKAGETTEDQEFTLETVNCLGACALGPIVVVDGTYFSNVKQTEVKKILRAAKKGLDAQAIEQDDRIFPVEVSCPRCNHTLMDPGYAVDGHPSTRLTISFDERHGWLRLSSLYGSYNVFSEYEIPWNTVSQFFCPHCHAELAAGKDCTQCNAPIVSMIVRGGGLLQICSRRGCRSHMLDLSGVNV